MDYSYIIRREKNIFSKYKLYKRCEIVYKTILKYSDSNEIKILDIGSCDGKMLSYIKDRIPYCECYGIEPEEKFIKNLKDDRIKIFHTDAENLNFPNLYFDFIILSLVIEHIKEPDRCLRVSYDKLKLNGKIILITVVPFYEKISVLLGIKKNDHYRNFNLSEISSLLENCGFKILSNRQMLLPLFYQLTVGEKNG